VALACGRAVRSSCVSPILAHKKLRLHKLFEAIHESAVVFDVEQKLIKDAAPDRCCFAVLACGLVLVVTLKLVNQGRVRCERDLIMPSLTRNRIGSHLLLDEVS